MMIRKAIRTWLGISDIEEMAQFARNRCFSVENLNYAIDNARKADYELLKCKLDKLTDSIIAEMNFKIDRINKVLEAETMNTSSMSKVLIALQTKTNKTMDEQVSRTDLIDSRIDLIESKIEDHAHPDVVTGIMQKISEISCGKRKIVRKGE